MNLPSRTMGLPTSQDYWPSDLLSVPINTKVSFSSNDWTTDFAKKRADERVRNETELALAKGDNRASP
jgi:hypothetical protein